MTGKRKPFTDHELYFGSFMIILGTFGILWKLFVDFPSCLVLLAGLFIVFNELYHRISRNGLEYYFPTLHHLLFRESMFDIAFNQNHVTRFIRMMSRFIALIGMRDWSEANTIELLEGIDDSFIHRLFSPGLWSMLAPNQSAFPIDRNVALAIIKERRTNPFKRPDMPYPVSVTARRILLPYVAGGLQTASFVISAALYKYSATSVSVSMLPASTGSLVSLLLWLRSSLEKPPKFEKHYPDFKFKSLIGGIDPLTIGVICKYRRFYH